MPSNDPETFLVMSYNVQGHAARRRESHLEEIAAAIRESNPDVVGLQEIHCRTFKSGWKDQAEELARLTGMNVYFGQSCSIWGGQYGNALLTRGEIHEAREHPLPGVGEPRSALEASIQLTGRRLSFFVTHLSLSKDRRRRPRGEQILALSSLVESSTQPSILVGDFNFTPRSAEMALLLESSLLRLSGEIREVTHRLFRRRIDYILTGPQWQTRRAGVLRVGPSDHWPLFAELSMTTD